MTTVSSPFLITKDNWLTSYPYLTNRVVNEGAAGPLISGEPPPWLRNSVSLFYGPDSSQLGKIYHKLKPIRMPHCSLEEGAITENPNPRRDEHYGISGRTMPRVLVVEDNGHTRFLIESLLQRKYDVQCVATAEEALKTLREQRQEYEENQIAPFDAFIIDINLGSGMSGTELLKKIHQDDELENVPALAITAYAMSGNRERFLNEGFDAYLNKPFQPFELRLIVQELLSRLSESDSNV